MNSLIGRQQFTITQTRHQSTTSCIVSSFLSTFEIRKNLCQLTSCSSPFLFLKGSTADYVPPRYTNRNTTSPNGERCLLSKPFQIVPVLAQMLSQLMYNPKEEIYSGFFGDSEAKKTALNSHLLVTESVALLLRLCIEVLYSKFIAPRLRNPRQNITSDIYWHRIPELFKWCRDLGLLVVHVLEEFGESALRPFLRSVRRFGWKDLVERTQAFAEMRGYIISEHATRATRQGTVRAFGPDIEIFNIAVAPCYHNENQYEADSAPRNVVKYFNSFVERCQKKDDFPEPYHKRVFRTRAIEDPRVEFVFFQLSEDKERYGQEHFYDIGLMPDIYVVSNIPASAKFSAAAKTEATSKCT